MNAREKILERIRARQGKGAMPSDAEREAVRAQLRAQVVSPRPAMDWEPVARFRERALGLASTVEEVASLATVPAAVAGYLKARSLPPAAVCWPEFGGLDWSAADLEVAAREAREDDLVGITGAFCAVAETGTLMMLSGRDTPATPSLLPETHIAVLPRSRIVRGMEEAWRLARVERGELPRGVVFISGPSRTADIEQTVTLGAHGPYRVHIMLTP